MLYEAIRSGKGSRKTITAYSTHHTAPHHTTARHGTAQHSTAQHSTAQHSTHTFSSLLPSPGSRHCRRRPSQGTAYNAALTLHRRRDPVRPGGERRGRGGEGEGEREREREREKSNIREMNGRKKKKKVTTRIKNQYNTV